MPGVVMESERREISDCVLLRAEWLGEADRALIEQVYGKGVRPADVAAVVGCSTRMVQRRVANLVKRLMDPMIVFVLRNHGDWDKLTAGSALAVLVRGLTLRDAASELGVSLHYVRTRVQVVRGLFEMYRSKGKRMR